MRQVLWPPPAYSRARAQQPLSSTKSLRPHRPSATCATMAGSPLKRQRKLGVRAEDGGVIAFPRLTHPRAGLSHAQWRALGPAEKIERLFGMSLVDLYEIMSWP